MDNHWFWHSWIVDRIEKGLLNLTHWIWAKRHSALETDTVPAAAPEAPAKVAAKTTRAPAKKTTSAPSKRVTKGNEWSVK